MAERIPKNLKEKAYRLRSSSQWVRPARCTPVELNIKRLVPSFVVPPPQPSDMGLPLPKPEARPRPNLYSEPGDLQPLLVPTDEFGPSYPEPFGLYHHS